MLFGAGDIAEKFLVKYHQQINIVQVFDNFQEGYFYGYPIRKPYFDNKCFIIVVVDNINIYLQIRSQLIKLGYREFDDFIPYTIYKKKMAVVYGNCHVELVKAYLEKSKEFNLVYGFYPLPLIQHIPNNLEIEKIINNSDLFMHQSIRRENIYGEKYSSEELLKYVKETCKTLALPNLYGMPKCFFPQLSVENLTTELLFSLKDIVDVNIKKWINEKYSINQMVSNIQDGGVYSRKYILELWDEFKSKLLIREEEWDIKISDYIFANYKKEKLFTNLNHISTLLAKEISNRVLRELQFSYIDEIIIPGMDVREVFIYEDVKRALGLTFDEKYIRRSTKLSCMEKSELDLEGFVETQVQICFFEEWNKKRKG